MVRPHLLVAKELAVDLLVVDRALHDAKEHERNHAHHGPRNAADGAYQGSRSRHEPWPSGAHAGEQQQLTHVLSKLPLDSDMVARE